jgi:hypothetical protein
MEMDGTNIYSKILGNLTEIYTDLQLLSDDVWANFDHNNNESLDKFINFKKKFNNLLSAYRSVHYNFHELFKDYQGTYKRKQTDIGVQKPVAQNEAAKKEAESEIPPNKTPSPSDLCFSFILKRYRASIKSEEENKIILQTQIDLELEIVRKGNYLYITHSADSGKPEKTVKLSVLTPEEEIAKSINRLFYDAPPIHQV